MRRPPLPATLSCALTIALCAGAAAPRAEEVALAPQTASTLPANPGAGRRSTPQDYRQAIRALESSQGAYADQLTEYLGSLGIDLQRRGKHRDALAAFKRGVHLARVNEGLYCPQQIPLLEREITSYMALGEYDAADERQRYLYRVQMHNLEPGSDRAQAFMRQADWQLDAYRLGLPGEDYTRLMNISNLYSLALNDIAGEQGQDSPQLIAPLKGMLQAQYLISTYSEADFAAGLGSVDNLAAQSELNRFYSARARSYGKADSVLAAIYEIQEANFGPNSPQTAEARAERGDWLLFHGKASAAGDTYREAVAELQPREDAQTMVEKLFGQPLELLDENGLRRLPEPVSPDKGELLLQFSVSASGRVDDLERLDESELDKAAVNRIMRTLRRTRFRPRLAMSGPIDTEGVVRAYVIQ